MKMSMRVPVVLRVGSSHIRVTSVGFFPCSSNMLVLNCFLGQIIANISWPVLQVDRTYPSDGCQRHLQRIHWAGT